MNQPSPTASAVRLLTVAQHHAGQRIDNFLGRELKGIPKSLIYRVLRTGQVRVNKGRVRPGYRLRAGDCVRIPPVRTADRQEATFDRRWLQRIGRAILHETEQFMVVDKPSGLAVHAGSGLGFGLIDVLRSLRPGTPLELVHRLDRDTSGCLLVAKSREALLELQRQLQEGAMDKRYLAMVAGRWPGEMQHVDAPLRKRELSGERMVCVDPAGKPAATGFKLLQRYPDASLLEAQPVTGRTHQIRVHAASTGHPVAGDDKYGQREFNQRARAWGLRRLFLHAHALGFRDPDSGAPELVSAPLPDELKAVMDEMGRQT